MSGYPAATIGTAFESAFRDFQWHSKVTSEGVRVVNFTGLLPANLRQDCVAAKKPTAASPCAQDAKVTFEWTFAPNGGLFHLSYVDPEPWPEAHRSTREMLLFIVRLKASRQQIQHLLDILRRNVEVRRGAHPSRARSGNDGVLTQGGRRWPRCRFPACGN